MDEAFTAEDYSTQREKIRDFMGRKLKDRVKNVPYQSHVCDIFMQKDFQNTDMGKDLACKILLEKICNQENILCHYAGSVFQRDHMEPYVKAQNNFQRVKIFDCFLDFTWLSYHSV